MQPPPPAPQQTGAGGLAAAQQMAQQLTRTLQAVTVPEARGESQQQAPKRSRSDAHAACDHLGLPPGLAVPYAQQTGSVFAGRLIALDGTRIQSPSGHLPLPQHAGPAVAPRLPPLAAAHVALHAQHPAAAYPMPAAAAMVECEQLRQALNESRAAAARAQHESSQQLLAAQQAAARVPELEQQLAAAQQAAARVPELERQLQRARKALTRLNEALQRRRTEQNSYIMP